MTQRTALIYADVVDLDRYPINDLDNDRGRAFVADCREQLRRDGVCNLPGFVTAQAGAEMIRHAAELASAAHSHRQHAHHLLRTNRHERPSHPPPGRTAAVGEEDDRVRPDTDRCTDPPAVRIRRPDEVHRGGPWQDRPVPQRRSIRCRDDRAVRRWRRTRLALRPQRVRRHRDVPGSREGGGHFEYYPGLRSAENDNHETIEKTLRGDGEGAVRLPSGPGSLAIFHGRNALHRVSPIAGSRPRINSVLTYGEKPDMRLNKLTQGLFYGRTQ